MGFAGIVNELFKPQLPSSQIVKMGIDVNDIGEVPVIKEATKRQSSTTGNGQLPANAQTNTDNKQSSTTKKEGKSSVGGLCYKGQWRTACLSKC